MKNKNTRFYINTSALLIMLVLIASLPAHGQRQSGRVYEFINLPATARITALGGYAVPSFDNDLGMALYFPSLINQDIKNQLSLNFVDYFGDISFGTAAFSTGFPRIGNLTIAVQYVNYGTFTETDEFGNILGSFGAGEYAIQFGWGRSLDDRFRIGSNLKILTSSLEQYSSLGIAADISVAYLHSERGIASSMVIRNIGRQIIKFNSNNAEKLPFDIVIGASKKLLKAPLRFSIVAHNLHDFDLTYDELAMGEGTALSQNGSEVSANGGMGNISDMLFRHLVFGMEFLPFENFTFSLGYNYRRRQEMKVDSRISTVGLSWGVGIKINRFRLSYGRSNYHLAGSPNHFSISANLDELFVRYGDGNVMR